MIDGEPLPSGTIRFVPEKGRAVSSAILSDGSFQLASNSVTEAGAREGVLPGKYRVAVSASKIVDEEKEEIQWLAPSHYADTQTSDLEVELQEPRDDLLIELTWAGAKAGDEESDSSAETEVDAEIEPKAEKNSDEAGQSSQEEQ